MTTERLHCATTSTENQRRKTYEIRNKTGLQTIHYGHQIDTKFFFDKVNRHELPNADRSCVSMVRLSVQRFNVSQSSKTAIPEILIKQAGAVIEQFLNVYASLSDY